MKSAHTPVIYLEGHNKEREMGSISSKTPGRHTSIRVVEMKATTLEVQGRHMSPKNKGHKSQATSAGSSGKRPPHQAYHVFTQTSTKELTKKTSEVYTGYSGTGESACCVYKCSLICYTGFDVRENAYSIDGYGEMG